MALKVMGGDLTTVLGTGRISRDEFIHAYDEAIESADFEPGDPILFDLTEASLAELTLDDCRAIADHEDRRRRERGTGRCALVVGAVLDFGVSRMIQTLREFAFEESRVSVFEDLDIATLWLKEGTS